MQIKTLFDPQKDIYRTIEKVITYSASQEERLRAEITEYIVTDSIEEQFEKLLSKMQTAIEMGGQNEVGVWVSGFYGSGKSSFTKYLGLALDTSTQIHGVRFLRHLQDRLNKPQTRALLATVASKHPAAVVMLDLASEMLAGATMEDVSTVLYYKVLQWAGYSQNLKVAAFEQRLQKDGRYEEFTVRIQQDLDTSWRAVQNDPLVIDSLLPELAHEFYPELFRTPTAFSTETVEFIRSLKDQITEMLAIIQRISGKQHILFIIDEVGQYVSNRQNLILNLQGLAENLKNIGDGKVWVIATAQQTLTEDDPRAALNSPELYKLKDRFPIQIDLESDDIKEICYRRLLGKSTDGEQLLGVLFDKHGQALRYNTKLQDAKYYDSDFSKQTFVNLYPFLPAHFDILLHLLGALAKSTGGIGLRSAIKVIQDILVDGPGHQVPVADQQIGWLATTVTLYDSLEKEIRRAYPSIHDAVGKVRIAFPDTSIHWEVAKTVAILQILGNMPVSAQNVTSLMHPTIDAPSRRDAVDSAVKELINHARVPFGEKDNNLCFFSEKLNEIDQERAQVPLRTIELRRIQNEALRAAFSPLPAIRLKDALAVTAGLKTLVGTQLTSLAGERETIQMVVEFIEPGDYDAARTRLVDESRQRSAQHTIYVLGRTSPAVDEKCAEIYRCREIIQRYRNDLDKEVKDYCTSLADRAGILVGEIEALLKRSLSQGSFIFRGQTMATDTLDPDVHEAAKKYLATVAAQVFDRYGEAPVRVDTALAEKFLRAGNLKAITSVIDPLGLVQVTGGTPRIQTDHKAFISIRDYLDRNGMVEGKRLSDIFTDAPFGWSPDTLRYLIAALLVAGEIKLKVSGREVTVNGQQAIEALHTNNTFKIVGVALRDQRPSMEVLARASERLTELTGDLVVPLEDEISKVAAKCFPQFQHRFGGLTEKLAALGLPGAETVRGLNQELADVLLTDASDAPQRLGGVESALYQALTWAAAADRSLKNGLATTVQELQQHSQEIALLPDSGIPGALRADLADELARISQRLGQDNFYEHGADFNSALTALKIRTGNATLQMAAAQQQSIKEAQQELLRLSEWAELTQEEQAKSLAQLDLLLITDAVDLAGFKRLLNQEYVIQSRSRELKRKIEELGRQRQLARRKAEQEETGQGRVLRDPQAKIVRTVRLPAHVISTGQLDDLIRTLQLLRSEIGAYQDVELTIQIES